MNYFYLISIGVIYACVFWGVCLRWPNLALALVFALSPFQQDVSGGGPLRFSMAEINLLLSVPIAVFRSRRWRFGLTFWPAVGFILLGLLCSLPNWRESTLTCLVQTGIYLVVAVFVFASLARSATDYRLALDAFLVVTSFLAACICILRTPYVLGLHKNGIGASVASAVLIALELSFHERRRRWPYYAALGILVPGLVMTLSRGAWLTAIVGMLFIFMLRRKFGQMLRAGLAVALLVAVCWSFLPAEARDYATGFSADRWNIQVRYENSEYAAKFFRSSPIFGAGVGLRKEYDATNVLMVTLAETGVLGVAAFALLHLVLAGMLWSAQRTASRRSLDFSLLAIAGALAFGKVTHGMVDHYWSRGALMAAWGAVGMAVWVAQNERRQKRRRALERVRATRGEPTVQSLNETVVLTS